MTDKVFNIIDPEYNFWEMYPEFKKIEEFKTIQKEFKTKSSDVMWFIVACFDLDSRFYNLELEERVSIVGKDYLKDKDFYNKNLKMINPAIEMIMKLVDTPAKRHLRQWLETLDKRTKFLRDTEYDLDNFDKIDKMSVGTEKIFKTFKIIQEELSKEKNVGATKGGHELSLADSEDI